MFFLNLTLLTAQSKSTATVHKKLTTIDSIPNIKIDKIIYYAKPIEFKFYALTDTSYIPVWYKTLCADTNVDYFKDYPKEAVHYFVNNFNPPITEASSKEIYDKYQRAGGFKEYIIQQHLAKFMYIFDEIWLTAKNDSSRYLILQGYNSENQIKNIKFSTRLIDNNIRNENVDTMKFQERPYFIFKLENDTLKWTNLDIFNNKILNDRYFISSELKHFKDICHRKTQYVQSEIEEGKRVFKLMEKDLDGVHKVMKIRSKPEDIQN